MRSSPHPGSIRSAVTLAAFFMLAFAATWWIVPLHIDGFPLFPFGPDVALLVVIAVTEGRAGLRRLAARLVAWRAPASWYALALLLPVAITLLAVFATALLGAPAPALPRPGDALEFVVVLPLAIFVGGPLGEEPAWRGYALPLLQRRFAPWAAVLVLGLFHAGWHAPLFLTNDPPSLAPFVIELLAGGVVLAWLVNSTGRVLLAVLMHGAHNMSEQAFVHGLTGADLATVQRLTALGWSMAAAVVVWRTRGALVQTGSS